MKLHKKGTGNDESDNESLQNTVGIPIVYTVAVTYREVQREVYDIFINSSYGKYLIPDLWRFITENLFYDISFLFDSEISPLDWKPAKKILFEKYGEVTNGNLGYNECNDTDTFSDFSFLNDENEEMNNNYQSLNNQNNVSNNKNDIEYKESEMMDNTVSNNSNKSLELPSFANLNINASLSQIKQSLGNKLTKDQTMVYNRQQFPSKMDEQYWFKHVSFFLIFLFFFC